MEIGEISPYDQIYNGLCNGEDIPLCAKYAIMSAIHDLDPKRTSDKTMITHKPGGKMAAERIMETIYSGFDACPQQAHISMQKWLDDLKQDIHAHERKEP